MKILLPLGFLGLIGLLILLLIYIVKPNYQKKLVSGTYVWKLSLKYKKKRLPTGKITYIILFICQVLLIAGLAFILARPVTPDGLKVSSAEKVIIIDGSVNMLTETDGTTRFSRAVDKAKDLVEKTYASTDGRITVIIAGDEAETVVFRAGADKKSEVVAKINDLKENGSPSYGKGDSDGAMEEAKKVVDENPLADVVFYTATRYDNTNTVRVEDVSVEGEWNAAILDVEVNNVENIYTFVAKVACYGKAQEITVSATFYGVNGNSSKVNRVSRTARCASGETVDVSFAADENEEEISSYSSVRFRLNADDNFAADNEYELNGGQLEKVNTLYYSSTPNKFWQATLEAMRSAFRSRWNFTDPKEVYPVLSEQPTTKPDDYTEGYDLYIFEGKVPDLLPKSGAILLINPTSAPTDGGFRINGERDYATSHTLTKGDEHPITDGVNAEEINVSTNLRITPSSEYVTLLKCGNDPVLIYKRDRTAAADRHVIVMAFSPNYSDVTMTVSFVRMMYNLFNYVHPTTVTDGNGAKASVFEVGEKVVISARGYNLTVTKSPDYSATEETFDGKFTVPGVYTVQQTVFPGETITEKIFVKIAAEESNIFREETKIGETIIRNEVEEKSVDWLPYVAAAAFVFLCAEWLLYAKENY